MHRAIGILGGMGPLATCDLFKKIVEITDADCDQKHAHVLIDNNTDISDRTEAILHHGANPVPEMVKSAVRLQNMGANVLIMPCNTAHYYYPQILPFVDIPFLHMPNETAKYIKRMGIEKIGLLATDGTIQSGIYNKAFETAGIDVCIPDEEGQKSVMSVIYDGVKAGNHDIDLDPFRGTMDRLFAQGAQVMVLACTELPVAFQKFSLNSPNIDPTMVLAASAIRFIGGKVKANINY